MMKRFFLRYRSLLWSIFGILIVFILMNRTSYFQTTNNNDKRKGKIEALVRYAEIMGLFEGSIKNFDQNYFNIKDSINNIKDWKVSRLRAIGDGVATGYIGAVKVNECDSCYSFDKNQFGSEYKDKYFIRLYGYTLDDEASFLIKNDKYYIEYTIWDTIKADGSKMGHNVKKEVGVRYSIPIQESTPAGSLLIPVSPKTYRVMNALLMIFAGALILLLGYIFIVLPVRTLYKIAEGHPFTKRNITRLYTIGWTLLAIPILPPLISVVVEWFLRNKIPREIYYPFFESVLDGRAFLIGGLVVLLIAFAFKKGYKLQEDQDLTV